MFSLLEITAPKMAIYASLLFLHLYFGAFSPLVALLHTTFHLTYTTVRYLFNLVWPVVAIIASLAWTMTVYIVNTVYFTICACLVVCWALVVYSLISFLTGHPASTYLPFLRLDKTVQAQLAALDKEKRRAIRRIEELVPRIERWNAANTLLMKDIRSAEVLVKRRVPSYHPHPDRVRFHPTGVQFRVVPTFADQQADRTRVPSVWSLVRWLKNQDEPSVFAARREAQRWGRVRTMRERAMAYLEREHAELQARLTAARARREEAWRLPEPSVVGRQRRTVGGSASEYQAKLWARARQEAPVYQELFVSEYARRLEEVEKFHGQVKHWCNACDERHIWLHQYDTVGAALSVPQLYPCPAAVARHERMLITFGRAPPPPTTTIVPIPTPAPTAPLPQPIYAAAPGPEPAAGRSFFSVPSPIQTVMPVVTQSPSLPLPPPPPPTTTTTRTTTRTTTNFFPGAEPPSPPPRRWVRSPPSPSPAPKPAPATVRPPMVLPRQSGPPVVPPRMLPRQSGPPVAPPRILSREPGSVPQPRIIPRTPGNVPPPKLIMLPPPGSAPPIREENKENAAPAPAPWDTTPQQQQQQQQHEEEGGRRAKRATREDDVESWEERRAALAARTRCRF